MSVSITRWAIPTVATGPWPVIDQRLQAQSGDWTLLRPSLIDAVAARAGHESGTPLSPLERRLLVDFYARSAVWVTFLDVLDVIRAELAAWPPAVRADAETRAAGPGRWEPADLLAFRQAAIAAVRDGTHSTGESAKPAVRRCRRRGRCWL
jgi:hypothetical protein